MSPPSVTIAIPTYKRVDYLRDLLKTVATQEYDGTLQVLVLDNACDAVVAQLVRDESEQASVDFAYLPVPAVGLHNCRHAAARSGTGDVLALIDDDVLLQPGWLQSLGDAFRDPVLQLATGPIVPHYEVEPPAWLGAFWRDEAEGLSWCGFLSLLDGGPVCHDIRPELVFGANFAVRRARVLELGGFHPDAVPWPLRRYRGDGETAFSKRLSAEGGVVRYLPGARLLHRVPAERLTPAYFQRRSFLQGISDSFSDARRGVVPGEAAGAGGHRARRPVWQAGTHKVAARLRRLLRIRGRRSHDVSGQVKEGVDRAYRDGYAYHREMLRTDATVREWVDRQDYVDCALP